jgi:hypothetical protein
MSIQRAYDPVSNARDVYQRALDNETQEKARTDRHRVDKLAWEARIAANRADRVARMRQVLTPFYNRVVRGLGEERLAAVRSGQNMRSRALAYEIDGIGATFEKLAQEIGQL